MLYQPETPISAQGPKDDIDRGLIQHVIWISHILFFYYIFVYLKFTHKIKYFLNLPPFIF